MSNLASLCEVTRRIATCFFFTSIEGIRRERRRVARSIGRFPFDNTRHARPGENSFPTAPAVEEAEFGGGKVERSVLLALRRESLKKAQLAAGEVQMASAFGHRLFRRGRVKYVRFQRDRETFGARLPGGARPGVVHARRAVGTRLFLPRRQKRGAIPWCVHGESAN
ncbi:hypothetical protein KM043_002906 [Ampulex compressa]|nr:hypothetical protein KM043_002906 [Ampulex compressa]